MHPDRNHCPTPPDASWAKPVQPPSVFKVSHHLEEAKASGEDLAPEGDVQDGEDGEPARVCPFCETDVRPLALGQTPGGGNLRTARTSPATVAPGGGGLQTAGPDAQAWLDRRAAWIEAETEAGRLQDARLDVRDLRLHPDLSEEGN